ncbi:MAG: hypothetical protein WD100_04450 [Tistlia sp.]|uniref:hypothetical protein n=1 Tax=Tistlia sp. TaxID=3057121 RepID=UPI0034A1A6E9
MTAETFNLIEIEPGARLRMANGAVVEVVENPGDGMWLFCRYLAHPANPALIDGGEHAVFAQDLVAYYEEQS